MTSAGPSGGVVKTLVSRIVRRRSVLKSGLGLGVLGSMAVATGCTVPLRGPGGALVAQPQAGLLHSMTHGATSTEGILSDLPREAPTPVF